jgi:hypothetical protein
MYHALALLLLSHPIQIDCFAVKDLAALLREQKYVPVEIHSQTPPYIILENPHGREIMLLFPDAKNACPVEVTKV